MVLWTVIVFWLFLASAFGLIFRFGGKVERLFASFLLLCSVTTLALNGVLGLNAAWVYVPIIDALVLVVTLWILAKSDAYWPIWFAGFHLIAVATGAAYLLVPSEFPGNHGNLAAFWALPALLALVLGTLADHRMRVAARVQA